MANAVLTEPKSQKKTSPQPTKKKGNSAWGIVILIVLIGVCAALGIMVYSKHNAGADSINNAKESGLAAGMTAYENAKVQAANEVYQAYYDSSYSYAEKKHHVSNHVLINIEEVTEVNRLDVLEASYNTVAVENSKDNDSGTFSWLSMTGSAVYYVNLDTAEYIIDQPRSTVIVRLSKPAFEYRQIDEIDELATHTKHKVLNGSVADGSSIANDLIQKGNDEIQSELAGNQENPIKAQEAAKVLITSLVKQANPEIHDLHVSVEFME